MDRRPTYLFTDIDGSVERWERTPSQMRAAIARHDALLDNVVERYGGVIRDRAGDGVFATFDGDGALTCALQIQLALQREDFTAVGGLTVRIGVHARPARFNEIAEQVAINRAARVMASAWGGQVVISADGAEVSALPQDARLDDLGYCRLRGVNEPLRLFSLVHAALDRTEFPPVCGASMPAWAAPGAPAPFFGRERERSEIVGLLEGPETRWVTVVGPGGNGKTRLATRVAADVAQKCGVWYVALDDEVEDADLVAVIARAIRLPLYDELKRREQLLQYLRDHAGLLVLDNAERAIGENEVLRSIVRHCPDVRVLATSRVQFGAPEEVVYRLGGFDVPARDTVREAPAHQLFVHEASNGGSEFALHDADLDAFVALCTVLGGSPLALRMAAQWSNMFSIGQIVDRVEEGLDFLARPRTEGDRHASLRSVFNGSWALLSDAEQSVLARLSVFVNGFDLAAADSVADAKPGAVASLEAKGLVEQVTRSRFQLHPLIREYALEKLGIDKTEHRRRLDAHASHYMELARSEFASALAVGQRAVLDKLESENANLVAAWKRTVESGSTHRVWKAAEALFYACALRARYRDAELLFGIRTGDSDLNLYFDSLRATCLVQRGDLEKGETLASEVLASSSNVLARSHALQLLGVVAHARGQSDKAIKYYNEALVIRRARRDLMGSHYSAISLAIINMARGNYAEARKWIKESAGYCEKSGNATGRMQLHFHAGELAALEGRVDAARTNFVESLRAEEEVNHPQYRARVLTRLGVFFAEIGDMREALQYLSEAHAVACESADRPHIANSLVELGAVLKKMGETDDARRRLVDSIRISLELGTRPTLLKGLLQLGQLEAHVGDHERARRLASVLSRAELGSSQAEYDRLVECLPEGKSKRGRKKSPENAAREIVAENDYMRLLL